MASNSNSNYKRNSNGKGAGNACDTSDSGRNNTSRKKGSRGNKRYNERNEKFKNNTKRITDAINDISWYAHNPQMLKDSASVAFSQMLGLPMYFGKFNPDSSTQIVDKFPGVCILRTVPSFGSSTTGLDVNPNSAINIAAQNLYSYVRHANSGHSNYDPTDLMMYIVAMDQAYALHAELVRAYGIIRFYSGFNRYLGKYLTEVLGFDYDNLLPNMAGFRYLINSFAARLSTFAVPAIFPIFERHRWLCSNVYMDRPSTRAQLYAFVPEYRGVYNEPVTAGEVEYKAGIRADVNTPYLKTLGDVSDLIDEFISPILHSEDIGIMSGDILKAYGADKCYQINALSEDYILGPVYVEEVLKQIHNAVTVGTPIFPEQNETHMLVYQEGESPIVRTWDRTQYEMILPPFENSLLLSSALKNNALATAPKLLDTNVDSPTPEEVMIMTRLMNIPRAIVTEDNTYVTTPLMMGQGTIKSCVAVRQTAVFTSLSADAVIAFYVYNGEYDANGYPICTKLTSISLSVDTSGSTSTSYPGVAYAEAKADIAKFNWHPILYEVGVKTNKTTEPVAGEDVSLRIEADIDNCVLVEKDIINRMHDVALLSMLNVPSAVLTKGV